MSLRGVGIDVADVDRIGRLLESYGERFVRRWFSADEIAECEASDDRAGSYAARYAAKEAVWKSLGLDGDAAMPWLSIVILGPQGASAARVALSGDVAESAARAGVTEVQVSWSISSRAATAVALAGHGDA